MKKGKGKAGLSFKGMSHGKLADDHQHMGPLGKGGKGKMKPQVSGHIDHTKLMHDAKGHDKGSRGPYTSASKGKSKSKD